MTLATLLLASSAPALASKQVKTASANTMSLLVASVSTSIPSGTYTQVVRKQFSDMDKGVGSGSEKSVSVPSAPDTVDQKSTQTEKVVQIAQATNLSDISTRPVDVSATPMQQVSRSESPDLVKNALSLQGTPYVFGGSSRKGFDCSGYTQYVYKGSGKSLPRSSYEQYQAGSPVSRDSLQSGDLVFFTTYSKGPSHVGIYIGGGNFVHASNSGVRITSLNDSYYAARYLGARRVS